MPLNLRGLNFRRLLATQPNVRWLCFRNNGGSVEHYYHFLLGYLLPLCAYMAQRQDEQSILLARACGPLSHLVCELDIPGLLLCERQSHSMLSRKADELGFQIVEILGLDCSRTVRAYDADRLSEAAALATQYIRQRLGARIGALCEELESGWKPSPRLMVVERGAPDPYYESELSERKGSGSERRSIANMSELVAALSGKFSQTKVVSLEGRGLAEQIALFRTADIVVAQHGAALANIVWMRPDTHVFEFMSNPKGRVFFEDLSPIFGVKHRVLSHEGDKGPVDVQALMDALATDLLA